MNESWLELAIIAFIIAGIGAAIWKGGAANPESTGALSRKLNRLDADVRALKASESKLATKEDVRLIQQRLEEHERNQQEIQKAVQAIDHEMGEMREAASARHATLEHVRLQVDRLYDHIVSKGMNA